MGKLFHIDSPAVQKLARIWDLITLNLLWILCSIPIVTAGAATAAMYCVIFRQLEEGETSVVKPFFRAFKENFRQGTILWLLIAVIGGILCFDGFFLLGQQGTIILLAVPLVLLALLLAVGNTYGFAILARHSTTIKAALRNAYLLMLLELIPTLLLVVVNTVPWVCIFFLPDIFLRTAIFWLLLGSALPAYINGKVLLHIFKKHQAKETAEEINNDDM